MEDTIILRSYKSYTHGCCSSSRGAVLFLLVVFLGITTGQDWPCTDSTKVEFIRHKTDCRAYFICENGKAVKMYCPLKFAYHQESFTCVPEDSGMEVSCIHRPTPYGHRHCKNGSTEKIADPKGCARYYDCGANTSGQFDDIFLRECPYPKLFHTQQGRCVGPTYKGCGNRPIPFDKCEYLAHQCLTSKCKPCRSQFGSCKGLQDGLNVWPGREGSAQFIYCRDQRYVRKGRCKPKLGKRTIFDPVSKKCIVPS